MDSRKHADHWTTVAQSRVDPVSRKERVSTGPPQAAGDEVRTTGGFRGTSVQDKGGDRGSARKSLRLGDPPQHSIHQPALLGVSKPTQWESHVRQSWPGAGTAPHQPGTAAVGDTREHGGLSTNVQQGPKVLEPEGISHLLSSQLRATRIEKLHA